MMKRNVCPHVAVTIAMIVFGSAMAPSAKAQSPADPSAKAPPAVAKYQVIPYSHNSAVMIDLQTGQTWKLQKDAGDGQKFVWVPIRKLETNMEVDDWEQRMEKRRAERRKRREAEFGEAPLPPDVEPFGFRVEIEEPQVIVEP